MCRVISMIVLFRVKTACSKLSICINWPRQHHDNPVGADFTGALGSLSVLTRWRKKDCFWWSCKSTKDVKRLFSKKEQSAVLRIIQACQAVEVKRQITVAVRLQTDTDPITPLSVYLPVQLFPFLLVLLSLPLDGLLHLSAWHVSDILNYYCVTQKLM